MTALKTGSVWWPLNLPPSSHSNQTSLSSLCPSVKCCCTASASLSPTALCAESSMTAGAQPVCPLQVGPRERAHISPSSWLIKTFSCSSPSSPSLTPCWSHQSSFDLQYLHHPPAPIVATENLRNGPPLPALGVASILLILSQSVSVGGVPGQGALLPVGSLPCGGSDHGAVLTTRDLAPQPTVIEVTSQAIPWWIIKRPETELRVT